MPLVLFRWSPQAKNHRTTTEGCGVGPGVLSRGGEGGGSTLEGISYRRPGTQSGHEGHRTLQEGYQPWRSEAFQCLCSLLIYKMNKLYYICFDMSPFLQIMKGKKGINFWCFIFHCRLLWGRFECHNCVCCVLYAWEQSTKLQIHHGQFIQVSVYVNSSVLVSKHFRTSANGIFMLQVCHWHTGAFGCRELYDCVFKWGDLSEKDANCRLAQKVLSADW